jgi:hypothetical protein
VQRNGNGSASGLAVAVVVPWDKTWAECTPGTLRPSARQVQSPCVHGTGGQHARPKIGSAWVLARHGSGVCSVDAGSKDRLGAPIACANGLERQRDARLRAQLERS